MRGCVLRKMEVARRISALPEVEQAVIDEMYPVYDRLEFLTITPPYVMFMFGLLAPFMTGQPLAAALSLPLMSGWILGGALYMLACCGIWLTLIEPARRSLKARLRGIIESDSGGAAAHRIIGELDPDMVRNAGNIFKE